MAKRADVAPIDNAAWPQLSQQVPGLTVFPDGDDCLKSNEMPTDVGLAVDKKDTVFRDWLQAVYDEVQGPGHGRGDQHPEGTVARTVVPADAGRPAKLGLWPRRASLTALHRRRSDDLASSRSSSAGRSCSGRLASRSLFSRLDAVRPRDRRRRGARRTYGGQRARSRARLLRRHHARHPAARRPGLGLFRLPAADRPFAHAVTAGCRRSASISAPMWRRRCAPA